MEEIVSQYTKNKSKKQFKSLKCHPKNKSFKKTSCLDLDTLLLLKRIWNKRHPDCKIKSRKKRKYMERNKKSHV